MGRENIRTMYEPLISVIVPVYKVELFLCRCIESVLHQTYTNWELILIDDGSPDQSGNICDDYANQDVRIHVIHQKNQGSSGARNAGLDIASGEFVYFLDSDDYILNDTLEKMVFYSEKGYYDIIMGGFFSLYPGGVIKENKRLVPNNDIDFIRKEILLEKLGNMVCAKLIKLSIFKDLRFPIHHAREDLYINPSIFFNAKTARVVSISYYIYSKENYHSLSSGANLKNTLDFKYGGFLAWLEHAKFAHSFDIEIEELCIRNSLREGIKALLYHQGKPMLSKEAVQNIKTALCKYNHVKLPMRLLLFRYFILHRWDFVTSLIGRGRVLAFRGKIYFRMWRWKKYGLLK